MRICIDLLPRSDYRGDVVVLIDVLRSCTVAPILFDNGLRRLVVTPSLREARRAGERSGALLLGERRGVPPEGFNYGNSPGELGRVDFTDHHVVLVSENAPRVLPQLGGAREVLLASLYNAGAVARAALALGQGSVSLVCCGFAEQEDLDDALAAGFIASELQRLAGGASLAGAARLAVNLMRSFPDPLEGLWRSTAGEYLRRLDHAEDIAVASLVSQSRQVPRLVCREPGERADLFHFEPAAAA